MLIRVCFVCSGNICRSPTAEVVLARQVAEAGLADRFAIDSAGTGGWHAGEDMDARSRATLEAAGYRVPRHAATQVTADLLADRDLVVALDSGHLAELSELAAGMDSPAHLVLLRSFDPTAGTDLDVGDPYYGGPDGFEEVLAQIERACAGLLPALTDGFGGQTPI
jgi:protein-tyrosine phosphatase